MTNDFLKDLNQEQKEAVLSIDGPMIILAGAGSGKTKVLTYKVVYLILEKNIDSFNILMTTFTNKAANEMKERIIKYLGTNKAPLVITFHSLCVKILRIDGRYIRLLPDFVIYDSQDQLSAVKQAMKKLDISTKDYRPGAVLGSISQAKNELIDPVAYANYARGGFQEAVSRIYKVYQKILKENKALDFDDLLSKTVELFEKNQNALKKYQNRFQHILIDEYQDTNHAQYYLAKMLSAKWGNICVVGDFSQSIYSWRGADFRNLEKFRNDFDSVKTFSLSQNYRSTQKILDGASSVISNNTTHPVLKLWTDNEEGEEIMLFEAKDEHNEVQFILNKIAELKYADKSLRYSDIAVFYRTNAQSRIVEEVFLHENTPYVLIGGIRFYERQEIKDIIAYLRLMVNPKDSVSKKRAERIGKKRLELFLELQKHFDYSNNRNETTIEILNNILEKTEYLNLYDEKDEEDRQRLENIKELRSVAEEFPNLTDFLENVVLVEQEYLPDNPAEGEKKDTITLMTLHAAKGLEFKVVFMVGMEEGLFPHSRSLMDKNELEEERRLCYVGMTRAKEKLFLTYTGKRLFFGQHQANIISRFILELPSKTLEKNLITYSPKDTDGEYLS